MAIQLPQGFKIGSREAVDSRILLTKAEMLNMKDSVMPDVYFAMCKDDGKMYVYNKTNEIDPDLGKFRVQDTDITSDKLAAKLPDALKTALASQTKDSGLAVDENGNISVQLNQEHLQIIDNKIDLVISTIEAVDGSID